MNDPVQMLIDAGAIPSSPFGPASRYAGVSLGRYTLADGNSSQDGAVTYVLRRFIQQARDIPVVTQHLLIAADRCDNLAAHYLGDAQLNWRIADANLATDPLAFTATVGMRIAIPTPPITGG